MTLRPASGDAARCAGSSPSQGSPRRHKLPFNLDMPPSIEESIVARRAESAGPWSAKQQQRQFEAAASLHGFLTVLGGAGGRVEVSTEA